MSAISDVSDALVAALKTVEGVRVYTDPGAAVDPPCVVLSLPTVRWEAACSWPTTALFVIGLIVAADERAVTRLWELLPLVTAALDAVEAADVIQAVPGQWTVASSAALPCYEIQVETSP